MLGLLQPREKTAQAATGTLRVLGSSDSSTTQSHTDIAVRTPGVILDVKASDGVTELAGMRFRTDIIESSKDLAKIRFSSVINNKIKLAQQFYNRIAVALVTEAEKVCIIFADKSKVTPDEISAVMDMLKQQGYTLNQPDDRPQGYFAVSTIVLSLSQGHIDANSLSVEREFARDSKKNALMTQFTEIVDWAYRQNADDMDFVVDLTSSSSYICFKIGGKYVKPAQFILPTDTIIAMLGIAWQKSAGGADAQFEIKIEQQAKVELDLPSRARVRLRWSGMANDKGTVVTMRIQRLGESSLVRGLSDAGYFQSQMDIYNRTIHSEGGLVILSGVVGSGKSTSLAALMRMLPSDIKKISIEDPVELEIPGMYQKTVSRDLTSTDAVDPAFVSAVRAIYRSALDVLLLGEIRDTTTGLLARQVAESGHSVYSTIHARSALGIANRLSSPAIGIPRDVLGAPGILKLLVYQALLPVTCPHCGRTPDEHKEALGLHGKELDDHYAYFDRFNRLYGIAVDRLRLRNPQGCNHCRRDDLPELNGYKGRTVVSEMIEPDERMQELIQASDNIGLQRYWRSLRTPSFEDENLIGKTTMECAVLKSAMGLIDPREIEGRFQSFETVEMERKVAERLHGQPGH